MSTRRLAPLVALTAALSIQVSGCSGFGSKGDPAVAVGNAREGKSMEELTSAWGNAGAVGEGHALLEKLAGTWGTAGTYWMQPGMEPISMPGESTKTLVLGGRFVREEYRSTDPQMPFEGIGYTGYDTVKRKYVGSWIDSMTTFMFTSEGEPTDDGIEGSGLMYDPLTELEYDSHFKLMIASDDSHTLEYWEPGPGGTYYRAMQVVYTRRKAATSSSPTLSVAVCLGEPQADGSRGVVYSCGGDGTPLTLTQLEQKLLKEAGLVTPLQVVIRADRDATAEQVAGVFNACHVAGITDIRVEKPPREAR